MPISVARRLSEGVGAWLQFEHHCNRQGLFSERYLSFPVGQILSAVYEDLLFSEYLHPVLSPLMSGPGKRPRVDFAVVGEDRRIRAVVETKWVGKTPVSCEDIIWDLIRLEMISHNSGAEAFFLLGGKRSDLTGLFESEAFHGPVGINGRQPLLHTTHDGFHILKIHPPAKYRLQQMRRVVRDLQDLRLPQDLRTQMAKPFPSAPISSGHQVWCWKVEPRDNRTSFLPRGSSFLRN
jgi:hypothetical protein